MREIKKTELIIYKTLINLVSYYDKPLAGLTIFAGVACIFSHELRVFFLMLWNVSYPIIIGISFLGIFLGKAWNKKHPDLIDRKKASLHNPEIWTSNDGNIRKLIIAHLFIELMIAVFINFLFLTFAAWIFNFVFMIWR